MTHEYVIAFDGHVQPPKPGSAGATAVGWAAEAVLAVGPDDVVRAISRGDSTFIDLEGRVVTPLPTDPQAAHALVAAAAETAATPVDVGTVLIEAGLLDREAVLEPGTPADLAFWEVGAGTRPVIQRFALGLVAAVKDGAFTEGDEHRGPFEEPAAR